MAFDSAGNLYVTTGSGQLLVFVPPFSAASTLAVTVSIPASPTIPGIAIGP
jgi:hypothetical protein